MHHNYRATHKRLSPLAVLSNEPGVSSSPNRGPASSPTKLLHSKPDV